MHDDPAENLTEHGPGGPLPLWSELCAAWGLTDRASPGERAQSLAARLAQQRFALADAQQAHWPLVARGALREAVRDAGASWRGESWQQALESAIQEFAAQYFVWPPTARRARWVALRHAAEFAPELQPRLEHLAAGLDVDEAALADRDARVQALLDEVRTTYPLPAAERAARRAALAREKRKRSGDWAAAAQQALRQRPAAAALGGDYLAALERAPARGKLIARHARIAKHTGYVHPAPMGPRELGFMFLISILMTVVANLTFEPRRPARPQYPPISTPYWLSSDAAPREVTRPHVPPPSYDPEQARIIAVLDRQGVAGVLPYRDLAQFQRWQPLVPARIIPANVEARARIFARFSEEGYRIPENVGVLETVGGIFVLLANEDFDALAEWLASHPHLNMRMLKSR